MQMMTLGWPCLFYGKVKFAPLCFSTGKGKTVDFSETIVVNDIKIGRCSQLNEYIDTFVFAWEKALAVDFQVR